MTQITRQIRKLTMKDFPMVEKMQTSVEDDYVLHIFPTLTESDAHSLFGLFHSGNLAAIAGYTLFPGGMAMLGRLRSDARYTAKGHATSLLAHLSRLLKKEPSVKWVGANTNERNKPARRVLQKIGLQEEATFHCATVPRLSRLQGTTGKVWKEVTSLQEKRYLLRQLQRKDSIIFPYECYYPLPLTDSLLDDAYLESSAFYLNNEGTRFISIKNDQKQDLYAQVKYFWNDHFDQPGFWETVHTYLDQDSRKNLRVWVDFTPQGRWNIPDQTVFQFENPWVLYGQWIHNNEPSPD